jgi:hypothetical protein
MSSNESSQREYALDAELGERYYRGDRELEERLTEETIAIIKEYIDRRFDQGRHPALRAAHAEATGRVSATFQVDDDLRERAPDLMRGVFATPGRTYQAYIRFSNGNPELQNHHLPDPRGMAIKLLEVVGDRLLQDERHTQDFILVNRPVFFGDDLERYNAALRQFLSGGIVAQHWSLTKLNLRAAPRHGNCLRSRMINSASDHSRPKVFFARSRTRICMKRTRANKRAQRSSNSPKRPSRSQQKKPLLVRVKILNASEEERAEVQSIIDQGLSEDFRRIDIEYD